VSDWQPIERARFVKDFTVADLRMADGRCYRATWRAAGLCTAWWPEAGQARKKAIGLYTPVAFRVVAAGIGRAA
jgi:hypothetical protein